MIKKIILTLLVIVLLSGFVSASGLVDDIRPEYVRMSPRSDLDGRATMSIIFNATDRLLGDAIGDTMEANYSWAKLYLNEDNKDDGYIIVIAEYINTDYKILQAYYSFMYKFMKQGYSTSSPIIKEDMAATFFGAHLSDDAKAYTKDNMVFVVRVLFPEAENSNQFGYKDLDVELRMDLGGEHFSSHHSTRVEEYSDQSQPLEDIPQLNNVLRDMWSSSRSYRFEEYYVYMDKEKAYLKFQTLDEIGFLDGYFNAEIHLSGSYHTTELIRFEDNIHSYEEFEVGGVMRFSLEEQPEYVRHIRRELLNELDYYQDIGRLQGGWSTDGTDIVYDFNPQMPLVFADNSHKDYYKYKKFDPKQMVNNYIEIQDSIKEINGQFRWYQLY